MKTLNRKSVYYYNIRISRVHTIRVGWV